MVTKKNVGGVGGDKGRGRLVNTEGASEYMGQLISAETLARWRKIGKGPVYVNIEGNYGYWTGDLDAYLARRTVHPTEDCA